MISLKQSDATEISATVESTTSPSWKDAYLHAQDLIDTIWGWLVFGILFSAALATIFPPGMIGAKLPIHFCFHRYSLY